LSSPSVPQASVQSIVPVVLSPRERVHLKARARSLAPLVTVGHAGVTPVVLVETARALLAHELIKVRIGAADRNERSSIAKDLAAHTDATEVPRVGKVLVPWKPRPTE